MAQRTKGTRDKPFRPSDGKTPEDIRQAEIRANERIDALARRLQDIEEWAVTEGYVLPT